MPTIKVNTSRLSSHESDMQSVLSRVNSILSQFDSVSRNLDWDIRAESNINYRLNGISRELSAEAHGISGMKNYLGNAVRQYNTVEDTNKKNTLKDEVTGSGSGTQVNNTNDEADKTGETNTSSSSTAASKSRYKADWAGLLFDLLDNAGLAGSILNSIFTHTNAFISDGINAGNIIEVANDCISKFGELAEGIYSGTSAKEILLGDWRIGSAVTELFEDAGEAVSATKGAIFKASWKNEFSQFSFSNATNIGSKINVAAKWAGTGLSAVTNLISNKEEQKENPGMSDARVISETVVETTIDFGTGVLATAGATALLGASAPAVAVGAAAVGAGWALNTVTEGITALCWGEDNKKNFTELVSDGAIDIATTVGKAAGSKVKKGFHAVAKWGDSLFDG